MTHLPYSVQGGHLPTYVAIPLATGIFFFMAAFEALVEMAGTAPGISALLAAGGVVLYFLIFYGDGMEQFIPLATAFLTLLCAGIIAKAFGPDLGMPVAQLRLLIVGSVMSALAASNILLVLRSRARGQT